MIERLRPVIVGLVLDVVDFIGGFIPIVGDVVDVVGVAYFWTIEKLDLLALTGMFELIPAADLLPTFTALGIYKSMRGGGE
ncbi:MAG: hypothetical protein FGF50_08645 [Candidatus Brockarchaeota archaeon]|nr:hypothetical protein [Candidatus Brockarchaeota archaeon]